MRLVFYGVAQLRIVFKFQFNLRLRSSDQVKRRIQVRRRADDGSLAHAESMLNLAAEDVAQEVAHVVVRFVSAQQQLLHSAAEKVFQRLQNLFLFFCFYQGLNVPVLVQDSLQRLLVLF